ncbi:MAG: hypothetical protein PHG05_00595 [Candidatus Nanoarchaeia archaeon]|nr:hypothetical protein [Candidatus Nanoarchaeia archaeon]
MKEERISIFDVIGILIMLVPIFLKAFEVINWRNNTLLILIASGIVLLEFRIIFLEIKKRVFPKPPQIDLKGRGGIESGLLNLIDQAQKYNGEHRGYLSIIHPDSILYDLTATKNPGTTRYNIIRIPLKYGSRISPSELKKALQPLRLPITDQSSKRITRLIIGNEPETFLLQEERVFLQRRNFKPVVCLELSSPFRCYKESKIQLEVLNVITVMKKAANLLYNSPIREKMKKYTVKSRSY